MASTLKVDTITTPDGTGNITTERPLSGSGASLTNLNATNLASGTVPTARLGSGTASSSTFLRGDQTYAEAGGGAWAVKTSGTFSAASSLGITGISKWTRIFLYNLRSSGGDLMFRTSSDNGSSYDSGGSDYQYYRHQNGFEGNSANQSQISTAGEAYSSTSQDDAMVILDIPNPTGTSPTLIKWELIHNDDASIFHRFGMGVRSSAADVDAIQISTPSGNITGSYIVTELN